MVTRNSDPQGHPSGAPNGAPARGKAGFTMVEVIIAIIVLAFGLLGMAGTTALVVRQITLADVATERAAALQTTIERLRALPFDSVTTGSDSVGIYDVEWTVTKPTGQWAVLEIITTGPGMSAGEGGFPMMSSTVADTFTHRILR